jgi:hypothetical protein
MLNEGNQIHNFISSSGSGTVINYGSGSDFLTSYGSGSGSTSQKVTVPVTQRCLQDGRNQAYKPSPVVQLVCAKDVRQSWPKNYTTDPVIEQGKK